MLSIQTSHYDEKLVVTVSGRIDSLSVRQLEQDLRIVDDAGVRCLILDMHQVDYMSAAGLRLLKSLEDICDDIRIAAPSARVLEVLQIAGLEGGFRVFRNQTEALQA